MYWNDRVKHHVIILFSLFGVVEEHAPSQEDKGVEERADLHGKPAH